MNNFVESTGPIPVVLAATTSQTSSKERKRKHHESPTDPRPKRLKDDKCDDGVSRLVSGVTPGSEKHAAIRELLELGKTLQRQQRQENQRRYRKKKSDQVASLDSAIEQLRQEIEKLERQHREAAAAQRTPSRHDLEGLAHRYFSLFYEGFQQNTRRTGLDAQLSFVRTAVAPDVTVNSGFGHEALMKSCWFLQWFGDVEVQLVDSKWVDAATLVVSTRTSVTFTEQTLRFVFPLLCIEQNDGGEALKLAGKLLGQRAVMFGSTQFRWDSSTGYLTGLVAQSDMVTPMLQLLESVQDVAQVLDRALISPDLQWRSIT